MKASFLLPTFAAAVALLLSGCVSQTRRHVFGDAQSAVQLRSIQGRVYETEDVNRVLRCAIATLQDFGFIVDQANEFVGVISGTAFPSGARISVYAFQREKQVVVRANVQHNLRAVTKPIVYQRFFDALSQSLFLEGALEQPDEAFIALQNDLHGPTESTPKRNSRASSRNTSHRNRATHDTLTTETKPDVPPEPPARSSRRRRRSSANND